MTDEFAYPTEDADAARAAAADSVAQRVREMLRRARRLESKSPDPLVSASDLTRDAASHYAADVRYLIGAIQTLVAERASTAENVLVRFEEMDRLASLEVAQLREERDSATAALATAQAELDQARDDVLDLIERNRD